MPISPAEYLTTHLLDDFLSSASLPKVERSKADIRKWLEFFREEFGADPIAMFEERASRGEVNNWRKKWLHSPKQHDMAGTHATRVLNWAVEEGRHIASLLRWPKRLWLGVTLPVHFGGSGEGNQGVGDSL